MLRRVPRESPAALGAGAGHNASTEGKEIRLVEDFSLDLVPAAEEGPRAGGGGSGSYDAPSGARPAGVADDALAGQSAKSCALRRQRRGNPRRAGRYGDAPSPIPIRPQTRPFLRAPPSRAARARPYGFWLSPQGRVPPKKLLKQLQHPFPLATPLSAKARVASADATHDQ